MNKSEDLMLIAEDGVRLVSPVLGFSIFIDAPLSSAGQGVLSIFERFCTLIGPGQFQFYATETMRSHKPVSKSALTMLQTWLKPGAPDREYVSLELKNGAHHQDAPTIKFRVHGIEPTNKLYGNGQANVVSIALPLSSDEADFGRFKELFVHACSVLPASSGIAGYTIECSRYESEVSESHAWAVGMRWRGFDICRIPIDCQAVGMDGMKGVSWLTAIGAARLDILGGLTTFKRGVPGEIEFIETVNGVVIQAGVEPQAGDVNRRDQLTLYKAVFDRLRAPIERAAKRSMAFNLATDYVEKTEQWYARLSGE